MANKQSTKKETKTKLQLEIYIFLNVLEADEKRQQKNKEILGDKYIESKFLCVMDNGKPIRIDYITVKFKQVFDKFIAEQTEIAKQKGKNFSFPYITLHKLRHLNISALGTIGRCISGYLCDFYSSANRAEWFFRFVSKGKKNAGMSGWFSVYGFNYIDRPVTVYL